MDRARVTYPNPEELHHFYKSMFDRSTERALLLSREYDVEKVCDLLSFLAGAEYQGDSQSMEGASYKSLAHVAHLYGLAQDERQIWYQAGEIIPVSQGHVSYLIKNIKDRNEMFYEMDQMVATEE